MRNPLLVVSLVLLLCFAFGCQNKAEKAELEKFRAQAKLEEQNKALVRQYLEALDSGSLEKALAAADATLAPDIISHFAEGDSEGIEHIKNNLKSDYESWSDIQHPIEQITAEGNIVVARITWKGKQNGIFMGIPATGKEISFPLMYAFRFEGGKIKERWLDYDSLLSAMTQLGMELKPKEAEKK
jgi:steroid delta-isomerase-like uncharacterized protein